MPSKSDFLSRGMRARFDGTDAQRDLNWHPNADGEIFRQPAVLIQAPTNG